METITCRACRSVNLAGTPRCMNCGADLEVLAAVAASSASDELATEPPATEPAGAHATPEPAELPPTAPPIPPTPLMPTSDLSSPPLPPATMPQPSGPFPSEPRGRRPGIAIVGVAIVLVVTAVVIVKSRGSSNGLPDQVAGLSKLDTRDAEMFEEMISSIEIMDMHIEGAMYGSDDQPQIMLEVFRNLPPGAGNLPAQEFFDGASAGFAGTSGGVVDRDEVVERTVGSLNISCAPVDLSDAPAPVADATGGVMCAWTGPTLGLLFDFRLDRRSIGSAVDEVVALQPDLS